MKLKSKRKAEGPRPSWKLKAIRLFVCLVLLVLICIPLVPLLALAAILPSILNLRIGESIGQAISVFTASLTWLIELAVYSIWLVLVGDYVKLFKLLPELIDWLRSAGLL